MCVTAGERAAETGDAVGDVGGVSDRARQDAGPPRCVSATTSCRGFLRGPCRLVLGTGVTSRLEK